MPKEDRYRLSEAQIDQFVTEGYMRINKAFAKGLASQARARMWRDLEGSPDDPST